MCTFRCAGQYHCFSFPPCNSLSGRKSQTEQKTVSQQANRGRAVSWRSNRIVSIFFCSFFDYPNSLSASRVYKRARKETLTTGENKKLRKETRCLKQTIPPILFLSLSLTLFFRLRPIYLSPVFNGITVTLPFSYHRPRFFFPRYFRR